MNSTRHKFTHQGNTVYEWEQSIDTINVYIKPPPIVTNKQLRQQFKINNPGKALPSLQVKIAPQKVTVGIKGNPPYFDLKTKGLVDTGESTWFVEGDILEIVLYKALKGQSWMGVFEGHNTLNPLQAEKINKSLLLERFQQQNPGFDFSSAQINGQVPQARSFMGGIKHN